MPRPSGFDHTPVVGRRSSLESVSGPLGRSRLWPSERRTSLCWGACSLPVRFRPEGSVQEVAQSIGLLGQEMTRTSVLLAG
jgi:hypothetical protein